ncbi:Dihydrogeodin oxidase [Colletotrichum fructicola]|uniref:Dihydrogeodin oxidase n=1 Tax=Colletotrichum fructicola (strain Nara gc5) TaxID=1213859 RepID=A0A7J6JDA4_COLFN|nr:Dihydrogeodin oxidase [Colletotrichum fructicola Nara gc5]KAF4895050.1 Dihydrogeodin oxidase [Colletotrichum fructicola]KAF4896783.1 Dihydrogeodin oxidase [Colletotrichum fructicola]KAF4935932.1 Dihydrogeodin oxidase [Colletotrichum fructicola]
MGFWKRLIEILVFSSEFKGQSRVTSDLPSLGRVGPLSDNFPKPDGSCNTRENRQCWTTGTSKAEGFNIETDYEIKTPEGVVREFYLEVTNTTIAPDGYNVSRMLFNGSYPGPTLEGNWGDTFRITVKNNLTNFNGTSIHWHGIRQLNTNWMDGVSGVTECPIPPGENFTYEWRAQQYGVSWYHSHFSLQYADGLVGALKINGPTSMNYDEDLGPVLITDNFHKTAFSQVQLEYLGRPPSPDSMLINGKGKYHCCSTCPGAQENCVGGSQRESFNFTKDRIYKMSLVNTGTSTHTTFWIDNHNFTVVAADFVPITPYPASIINVAIGQRYDIIIVANATKTDTKERDFWIHARDCSLGGAPSNLGIIRYDHTSTNIPHTPPVDDRHVCYGCLDEKAEDLKPIVKRTVEPPANSDYKKKSFKVHLVGYPNAADNTSAMHKWVLKDSSFYLDWTEPSLSLVKVAFEKNWDTAPFPTGYEPVFLDDYKHGDWVYWLIEGKFQESVDNSTHNIYKKQAPVAHPMHIHGHDFVILAQSTKEFNGTVEIDEKTFDNPARRDVALLPVDGYLLIAFQINNPGIWLMHCHIAWHASGGLALQFIESPKEIGPAFAKSGVASKFSEQCTNWAAHYTLYNKNFHAEQDDSGI